MDFKGCAVSVLERQYDGGYDAKAVAQEEEDERYVREESRRIREEYRDDPLQVIRAVQITYETRDKTPGCIDGFIDALAKTQCPLILAALKEYSEWQARDDL